MKKICILALAFACFTVTASHAQLVTSTTSVSERTITKKNKNHDGLKVWYEGELNFGFATGGKLKWDDGEKEKTDYSRPFISTVHGARITKYGFVGLGFGAQYAFGKMNPDYEDSEKWKTLMIPVFLNLKGYYPVNDNFAPYVSISLGSSICATSSFNDTGYDYGEEYKLKGGFYGEYGVGLKYKKFNFSFGLQHQSMKFQYTYDGDTEEEKASVNSFYVKLGVTF